MLLSIGRWGRSDGTGEGVIDILVREGGGLVPTQRVLRGGGGTPYFKVTKG